MGELFATLKIFILSLILLALLQIKWNGVPLEGHALQSLHQSHIGQSIEEASMGAAKAIQHGYAWTKSTVVSSTQSLWDQWGSHSAPTTERRASR